MTVSRRAFLAGSASALAASTGIASAATPQCNAPGLPSAAPPNRLLVDCASRRNFRLFRQNPDYVGLAGLVSLNFVQGKPGSYPAGTMMLFPWLKPKGVALGAARVWPSYVPIGNNQMQLADAIRVQTLPADDYFCRVVLNAPWSNFIGFVVDAPRAVQPAQKWVTNVDKLADGAGIGIDWSSANLNTPWFGGSPWIPAGGHCQGKAWRAVIVDGLNQASIGSC